MLIPIKSLYTLYWWNKKIQKIEKTFSEPIFSQVLSGHVQYSVLDHSIWPISDYSLLLISWNCWLVTFPVINSFVWFNFLNLGCYKSLWKVVPFRLTPYLPSDVQPKSHPTVAQGGGGGWWTPLLGFCCVTIAVVTVQTFYQGKLDLLAAYLGKVNL